jgi:SOS response regulatory protein OraA/RecX
MPYQDADEGHRIIIDDVLTHCRQVFDQGLQLEAILLAHEYLEQRLNNFYKRRGQPSVHRKFKHLIDALYSGRHLSDEDYAVLNEFNRLRNVNSHRTLDNTLELRGAKKGDMERAMDLAQESDTIITVLSNNKTMRKKRK